MHTHSHTHTHVYAHTYTHTRAHTEAEASAAMMEEGRQALQYLEDECEGLQAQVCVAVCTRVGGGVEGATSMLMCSMLVLTCCELCFVYTFSLQQCGT
jgi:hypothetical protein